MSLTEAFLCDIREHPEEDAPRMACADWLQEQPDEASRARGEFIAIQCGIAQDEARGIWREQLKKRQRQLSRQHRAGWLGAARPLILAHDFRRGFLHRVLLASDSPGPDFLVAVADLFHREPCIRQLGLRLGSARETLLAVVRLAEFPSLHSLDLAGNHLDTELLCSVLAETSLHELRKLDLTGAMPLDTHWGTVAQTASLASLEALILQRCNLTEVGVTALARGSVLARLVFLSLGDNPINAAGLAALSASTTLPELRSLCLRGVDLRRGGLEALLSGWLPWQLHRLILDDAYLPANAIDLLVAAPALANLRQLSVQGSVQVEGGTMSDEMFLQLARRFGPAESMSI